MNDALIDEVLLEGTDDWVPLVGVMNTVRDDAIQRGHVLDDDALRAATMGLVREMVRGGLTVPGIIGPSGHEPCVDIEAALADVDQSWAAGGDWSFALWLANTDEGDRRGVAHLRPTGQEG